MALPPERVAWPTLSQKEQAFVVAYVDNSYSVAMAAQALQFTQSVCKAMLSKHIVKTAIAEVQSELSDTDFMNEKWVRAQLIKLYPMVIGEEEVPFVNSAGEQVELRKFYPDIALRIIEYVVPKNKEVEQNDESNVTVNVYLPDNGRTLPDEPTAEK